MKYKNCTIALLIVSSFFLTACTMVDIPLVGRFFNKGVSNEPVTLKVWGLWESPEVINEIIKKYQEQNPNVTVVYEDRSVLDPLAYKETLLNRAGSDTSVADVFLIHNSWVPSLAKSLSPAPTSVLTADSYKQRFYDVSAASAVDTSGNVYAVPFYYDGLVLVYNKKHFDSIGQLSAPTAWEEFRRLALQLSVYGGQKGEVLVRAGAAMGTSNNIDHFSDILGLLLSQTFVQIPEQLDSEAAVDTLNFYTTFAKDDKVWNSTFPEAVKAFTDEKVSMIFVPSWQVLNILQNSATIDLGVAVPPQVDATAPKNWGTFWMFSVPKNSKNSDIAWDFINFATQDDQQKLAFSKASTLRFFGTPYASKALAESLKGDKYLGPVLDTASTAVSAEIAGKSGNDKQVEALKKAVEASLTNSKDLKAILTEAKNTILGTPSTPAK